MLHSKQTWVTNCTFQMQSLPAGWFGRTACKRIYVSTERSQTHVHARLRASSERRKQNKPNEKNYVLLSKAMLGLIRAKWSCCEHQPHVQHSLILPWDSLAKQWGQIGTACCEHAPSSKCFPQLCYQCSVGSTVRLQCFRCMFCALGVYFLICLSH